MVYVRIYLLHTSAKRDNEYSIVTEKKQKIPMNKITRTHIKTYISSDLLYKMPARAVDRRGWKRGQT